MNFWIKIIRHLYEYRNFYETHNWNPQKFIAETKTKEKMHDESLRYFMRDSDRWETNCQNLMREKNELIIKHEAELIHLKDLVQAKDMIIKKITGVKHE